MYRENYDLFHILLEYHYSGVGLLDLNKSSKDEKQRIETPLITACRLNCYKVVEALVKAKVKFDELDNYQHTALWVTTRERNFDIIKILVENGAAINAFMKWNQNPLYYAIERASKRTKIAEYLIQHGACTNIDQSNKLEPQQLLVLASNHDMKFCCLLVECGCTITLSEIQQNQEKLRQSRCGPNLVKLLLQEATNPAPLQRLCKTVVRRIVGLCCKGRYFIQQSQKLPLPAAVIDSLLLKDVLHHVV